MSGIIQEKTAPEIFAQIPAQNSAGHARMMPFDAPVWPVNRTKQTSPAHDQHIRKPLLYLSGLQARAGLTGNA
jgi:hypothetical protein